MTVLPGVVGADLSGAAVVVVSCCVPHGPPGVYVMSSIAISPLYPLPNHKNISKLGSSATSSTYAKTHCHTTIYSKYIITGDIFYNISGLEKI